MATISENITIDLRTFQELKRENDVLRGILAESPLNCIYCGEAQMHHCRKGFPGCSRADDLMVYQAIKEKEATDANT